MSSSKDDNQNNNNDEIFLYKDGMTDADVPKNVKRVKIDTEVKRIEQEAFWKREELCEVDFSEATSYLEEIGIVAFYYCISLSQDRLFRSSFLKFPRFLPSSTGIPYPCFFFLLVLVKQGKGQVTNSRPNRLHFPAVPQGKKGRPRRPPLTSSFRTPLVLDPSLGSIQLTKWKESNGTDSFSTDGDAATSYCHIPRRGGTLYGITT